MEQNMMDELNRLQLRRLVNRVVLEFDGLPREHWEAQDNLETITTGKVTRMYVGDTLVYVEAMG